MEETFFLNIDLNKTNTHIESKTKTRIWPSLLSFNNWIMQSRIPGMVADGTGITLLVNSSIIVEGLITDLIVDFIKNQPESERPVFNPDRATWKNKKPLYNQLFEMSLETFPCFQTIDVLITFRNNLAHGRSHDEVVRTENSTGVKGNVESENGGYQIIRNYLIEKRLLTAKEIPSNADCFWKYHTARIIALEVKQFLSDLIKQHTGPYAMGITTELEYALVNAG